METNANAPSKKFRALLLENVHQSADQLFEERGIEVVRIGRALSPEELIDKLPGFHLLGIRSKTHVTAEVLDQARDLIGIGAFCIGTNQIDIVKANRCGVPVFNAPFSNTRSVAELIIAEVVMLSRQLGDRLRELHTGAWHKSATHCHEIRGKTLGIVGYGHIGSQVGVLAEAMGMRVLFFDILKKLPMGNNRPTDTLERLLVESDFVTLHVPATDLTKMMMSGPQLATMKKGAYLLNASRGSVVDIDALAEELKSGHIAGAAIDVYPSEPKKNGEEAFSSPLQNLGNVILTPHIGGSTEEAQEVIGQEVGTSLAKYATTGATTDAVNYPRIDLPKPPNTHRILNTHQNVPGVMSEINRILSDRNANIHAQQLATDDAIGYLITDLDQSLSQEVRDAIAALPTSIKTRILD